MDFNFYEEYKNSSTIDLLLIVKQPTKYQQAATDAAKMILRERNVSEAEEARAVEIISSQQPKAKVKKRDEDKSLSELLDPLTDDDAERPMERPIFIGLIIVSVFYSWVAYNGVKNIILDAHLNLEYTSFTAIELLNITWIIAMLMLLWKRNPWGWRLFVTYLALSIVGSVYRVYNLYTTFDIPFELLSVIDMLWPSFIKLGVIVLMCTRNVYSFFFMGAATNIKFNITRATVKKALIIMGILAVVYWLLFSDIKIIS